jgi:hypothetical protein
MNIPPLQTEDADLEALAAMTARLGTSLKTMLEKHPMPPAVHQGLYYAAMHCSGVASALRAILGVHDGLAPDDMAAAIDPLLRMLVSHMIGICRGLREAVEAVGEIAAEGASPS